MNSISVVMSLKSIFINSLLVAIIPVVLLFWGEWSITRSVSSKGMVLGLMLFLALQGYVLFQCMSGEVSVENGVMRVRSGFYSTSWPSAGVQLVNESQAALPELTRVNGVALYGLRAGWFRGAARDVFMLTLTNQRACLAKDSEVFVCLDKDVIERLKPNLGL